MIATTIFATIEWAQKPAGGFLHTCGEFQDNRLCRDESEGRVKRVCEFWDERYGKNRSITDVDWSLQVSLVHNILTAL